MARKANNIPQSQAPYRPSRASGSTTLANTEPHELREKSTVTYDSSTDTEENSAPATQSSDGDGLWWSVRRITAERRRRGKKEYKVEWEGIDEATGKPWPQEWKPWNEVTTAVVEEWEQRKARKKRGRDSSSPSPVTEANVSRPVKVAREEIERYRKGKKRIKMAREDPILISSSSEEEPETAKEQLPKPVEGEEGATVEECSDDGLAFPRPLVKKMRHRRIVESSQSTGDRSQIIANNPDTSRSLSEKLVAVEIVTRDNLDSSLYASFSRASSAPGERDIVVGHAPLSISNLGEDPCGLGGDGGFAEITLFGRTDEDEDEAQIQVPRTQSSIKDKREVPDSQSSGATSIHLTPADQRPIPETSSNNRPTGIPSPAGQLLPIQELDSVEAALALSCPQSELGNDFEEIPDSSNRVFSQDVRELKSQGAQSQSSKESQQSTRSQPSYASLPSAQPSFGKIGVTPSFQSFTSSRDSRTPDDIGDNFVNIPNNISMEALEAPAVLSEKSVVGEASSFSRPDQPSQAQTPSLEPLTATNQPRRIQQSASTTNNDSFLTPNSFPEASIDDAPELATALEHLFEPLASDTDNTIRILQEAVESRPVAILDSDPKPLIEPAQLENTPSHDQGSGQGEAVEPSNLPQLHSLVPSEPLPAGRNSDLLKPPLDILSPRTPVQEEDPLQGGRSASSTPSGPIPASARPTPVTVLGYFPSQRPTQKDTHNNGRFSSNSVISSSAALHQAVSKEFQGKVAPSPLITTDTNTQQSPKIKSNEDTMSVGAVSPIMKMVDIVAPEHRLSPQGQAVATRSSDLLTLSSSSHPIASPNTQSYLQSEPTAPDIREKTPIIENMPIIDDDYLAASQALQLLQDSPRSALNEVFLGIPLTQNQRKIYQETILDRYREVEAFYGINNTQNQGGDVTLAMIENIVSDLDMISSHWELSEGRNYTVEDEGPKLVKWFRKQSSKFDLLFRLLKRLRDESYSVALVLQTGMLMEYTDIFLRSTGYQFTRFGTEKEPEVVTPTSEVQQLRLFMVPSCEMSEGISMPRANIIITLDSSLNSSLPHIQQLRRAEAEASIQAPIIHLIPVNTVAHIRQYLQPLSGPLGGDSLRDHLTPILYAAILVRDHAGILPQALQNRLDALSSGNVFSWLESLQSSEDSLLPTLPLKSQIGQRESSISQGVVYSTSPARKRILSQSAIPNITSIKHKRPRIDPEQESLGRSGDIPMPDSDDAPKKPGTVQENPIAKETEVILSVDPASDISGTVTHVTSTMPTEAVKLAEHTLEKSETVDKDVIEGVDERSGLEPLTENEEESDEAILQRLSKDDIISLLREYQEALWESKVQSEEWERHTANREIDYQEQREKVLTLKQTLRWQEKQIETLSEQRDRSKMAAEQATLERDLARDELRRFREALQDSEEGEARRAQMMIQNMELSSQVNSLERKRQSAAQEVDFIRQQYQIASHGSSILLAEKNQLEEQVEILTRQADGVKVQLKKMNMDRERSKYQHRISELTVKLERANKQITSLEIEKKRVERTRGLQTRASSNPPRGAQSSPVPTRPGSPLMTTHRQLRNSESA